MKDAIATSPPLAAERWHSALVVFEIRVGSGQRYEVTNYSVTVMLVRAATPEAAAIEASRLAAREEASYVNVAGESVEWVFAKILDVRELGSRIRTGADVYSVTLAPEIFARVAAEYASTAREDAGQVRTPS